MAQPQAFQASHTSGKAVFSTRGGQYPQRGRESRMSLVIRSDTNEDRDTMAARLRDQFPELCRDITTFGVRIGDYFDDYDQHLHGERFLHAVLLHIAQGNAMRAKEVQDLASRWLATNAEAFEMLGPGHCVEDVFTKEDREEREFGLLEETLRLLLSAAHIKYATSPQGEEHPQERRRRVIHEHREFIFSQAPDSTTFPPQPNGFSTLRVLSNPEKSQTRQRQGPMRRIPLPVGQFPTQQVRYPQQKSTPSTEVLEHVIPGSINRADLYSDPASSTVYPRNMEYYGAIPSRGLPGPFSYTSLPYFPLEDRRRNYNSCVLPGGKKNPAKQSSDDARKASYGEGIRRWSSVQGSVANYGFPRRLEATQSIAQVREGQLSDMQIRPTYPGDLHVNQPNRYMTTPRQGRPEKIAVQASLPPMAVYRQEPPYAGAHYSMPAPESVIQTVDPYVFGRQIQGFQPASPTLVNLPVNDRNRRQNPSDADERQHQPQQASKTFERRTSQGMVQGQLRGTRIWIARIPRRLNVSAILEMLNPCRGLQGITEPKAHAQDIMHTFVYASFNTQDEAQEAVDRLPKTHFNCLGEGKFLKTDWPYQSPHPNQNAYNAKVEHLTSHTSPTTTRKGKASETPVMGEAGTREAHNPKLPENPGMVSSHCRGEQLKGSAAVESVHLSEPRFSQSSSMAVSEIDSATMNSVSKPRGAVPSPTVSPVKHRRSTAAHNEGKDQAGQSEEPALSQLSTNDKATSTVHGTNNPTTTVEVIARLEHSDTGATPRQPCVGPTTPCNKKKTNQKAKPPVKPQNIREATKSQAVSFPENTKPRARSDTKVRSIEQDASVKRARQSARSDAAEARDAEAEAKKAVAIPYHPVSPATTFEAQSLLDSSNCATLPRETYPTGAVSKNQPPISVAGPAKQENPACYAIGAGHSGKPHSKGTPTPEKKQAGRIISGSEAAQFAPEPSQASRHSLQGEGQQLAAQHMSWNGSNSTNMDGAGESVHYFSTASASYLQTERSNSLVDGSWTSITYSNEPSPNAHPQSAGVDPEKLRSKLETGTKATTSVEHDVEPSENLVDGKGPAPIQTRLKKKNNPKKSKKSGAKGESKGPVDAAGKQQHIDRVPTSSETSKLPSSISDAEDKQGQATGPKEEEAEGSSISTVELELRTSPPMRLTYLPEPETPFRLDSKPNLPDFKDHRQRDDHERKPCAVHDFPRQSEINGQLGGFGYAEMGSSVTGGSQELKEAVEEAGYLISPTSSGARHFAVKDPTLALLYIFEQEQPSEKGEASDDRLQFSEKGKTFMMRRDDMQSACEGKVLVEQAAAAKRIKEDSSPFGPTMDTKSKTGEVSPFHTPTKESKSRGRAVERGSPLQTPSKDVNGNGKAVEWVSPLSTPMGAQTTNKIEKEDLLVKPIVDRITIIATQNIVAKVIRGDRQVGNSVEDRKAKEARILLDTLPQHKLSEESLLEWINKAEQYIKDNDMSDRRLPLSPTGQPKNGDVRPSGKSLMTSLQDQDRAPQESPVVVQSPGFKTAYIRMKPGEEAEQVLDGHLANGETLFGTTKYKLSCAQEIHAISARPDGAMTLLSSRLVDPSTSSEERQRQDHTGFEPLENKAVGYWNQNSGFKDHDEQEDLGKGGSTHQNQKEDGQSAIQRHNSYKKRGEAPRIRNEIKSKKHQTKSSAGTSRDQHGEVPMRIGEEPDLFTARVTKARNDSRLTENLASSSRSIAGDDSDVDTKVIKSAREDAEYPVLPRGRSDHVKGDDSGAMCQGGYAAAARKSIDDEWESEENGGREKAGKKKVDIVDRKDPWAPDDVWGPGKTDGKRRRCKE